MGRYLEQASRGLVSRKNLTRITSRGGTKESGHHFLGKSLLTFLTNERLQDFLREKPLSLFTMLGWSSNFITSLMIQSMCLESLARVLDPCNWI
jgi:hypothetical protein